MLIPYFKELKSNKESLKEAKSIALAHQYMTFHFPDLVQALQ